MPASNHDGTTRPLVRTNGSGGHRTSLSIDPGYSAKAVTPNNGADLPDGPCRGLYVGVAGHVRVQLEDDAEGAHVLFKNLAAGVIHWIAAKRVRVTDTTATDILAIY